MSGLFTADKHEIKAGDILVDHPNGYHRLVRVEYKRGAFYMMSGERKTTSTFFDNPNIEKRMDYVGTVKELRKIL